MNLDNFILSDEALSLRRLSIGGSDANVLMSGDAERIHNLYLDKIGQPVTKQPPSLNMLMGHATELLNQAWYTHQTGDQVTHTQSVERMIDPYPAHATLDGLCLNGEAVWEAKHTSGYDFQTKAKKDVDSMVADYYAQLHHNMRVCGVERAVLSVFFDNNRWESALVEADPFYMDALIDTEASFWDCVVNRREPHGYKPVKAGKVEKVQATRNVDFTGNNQWSSFAQDYLDTIEAAKRHEDAKKALKGMVEEDVASAIGHGVKLTRDKRGAIRFQ